MGFHLVEVEEWLFHLYKKWGSHEAQELVTAKRDATCDQQNWPLVDLCAGLAKTHREITKQAGSENAPPTSMLDQMKLSYGYSPLDKPLDNVACAWLHLPSIPIDICIAQSVQHIHMLRSTICLRARPISDINILVSLPINIPILHIYIFPTYQCLFPSISPYLQPHIYIIYINEQIKYSTP
jgi:hypothetical protein